MEDRKQEKPATLWLRKKDEESGVSRTCEIARNIATYNLKHMGVRVIMCAWHGDCKSRDFGASPECSEDGTRLALKKGEKFYRFLGRKKKV